MFASLCPHIYARISILLKYVLNANLFIERRKLRNAMVEVGKGIDFVQKAGFDSSLMDMYSCKALINLLM